MKRLWYRNSTCERLCTLLVVSLWVMTPMILSAQSSRAKRGRPSKTNVNKSVVVEPAKTNTSPVVEPAAASESQAPAGMSEAALTAALEGANLNPDQATLADIEGLLLEYKLALAQEFIQRYIKRYFPDRTRITPEAHALETRIERAHGMLQVVDRVELLDSVRTSRALIRPGSSFTPNNSWAQRTAAALINGFVDKRGVNRLRTTAQQSGQDIVWESKIGEQWMPHQIQEALTNTPASETNPVLAEDGYTIIYAVEDSTSLGGYDLFSRRYISDKQTIYEPVALGYPFNSPYNDYALLYDEELDRGILISDRFCPADSVAIYTFRGRPSALGGKPGTPVTLEDAKAATALLSLSGLALQATPKDDTSSSEGFYFPLKRGVVCRSWRDFTSNQALESFRKAKEIEISLRAKRETLRKLRAQAHQGKMSEAESKKLQELINEVATLQANYERSLMEAKNFEIQQRKL